MKAVFRKNISFIVIFSIVIGTFSGCGKERENQELTTTGFAFDTTYTITLYEGGSKEILNSCVQKCSEYEKIFSRTLKESQLYQMNEIEQIYDDIIKENDKWDQIWNHGNVSYDTKDIAELTQGIHEKKSDKNEAVFEIAQDGTITFQVSDMLADILKKGIFYSDDSKGAFDIAIEPITSLWDFTAEKPRVPEKERIEEALQYVDYKKVSIEKNNLTFQMPGMGIDLGGIAKGYIADKLKEYLKEQGVSRAIINLGGNILCVGKKSSKEMFSVGIQQPFADRNETVAAVSIDDMSVVSSGIYERYFTDDNGKRYHHIINPKTGYSYENDLMAVTILSKDSVDGDGLSTTCFSLGKDRGMEYIDSLDNVYAMFITQDEKMWYSEGFEDYLIH